MQAANSERRESYEISFRGLRKFAARERAPVPDATFLLQPGKAVSHPTNAARVS